MIDRLISFAAVSKEDVVLDIGSGDGGVVQRLVHATGCRAVGVEVNPLLCEIARDRSEGSCQQDRTRFITCPAEKLQPEDYVDVTVAYIYALNVGRNPRVIMLLQRLLAQGARIVTSPFALPSGGGRFPEPVAEWPDAKTDEGLFELLSHECQTSFFLYQGGANLRPSRVHLCEELEEICAQHMGSGDQRGEQALAKLQNQRRRDTQRSLRARRLLLPARVGIDHCDVCVSLSLFFCSRDG
jgi:ubiquinone/menaquinone biosynthesis C-methylase UbiE